MTKWGVETDLEKTPYTLTVEYDNANIITFCFSSDKVRERFEERRDEYRQKVANSLTARFRMDYTVSQDFADIALYRYEERRGFYIIFNGDVVTWASNLKYDGQKLSKKV